MYDSVDISTIPATAEAVAGYTSGHWPTYNALVAKFPHAHHLSIAVNASERARCLDIEPGDATNSQAPGWFRNVADHSQGKPVLYTYASNGQALVNTMSAAGIARSEYFLWLAHFTGTPHICGPHDGFVQADLTQWTDKALGRNLDASMVEDVVFGIKPAPDPRKNPTGIANFEGSLNVETGHWTVHGAPGTFKAGTNGGKAAAYLTFDESTGVWSITPEPWDRKPKGVFNRTALVQQNPTGVANFAGSLNVDRGTWTVHGTSGDFRPGRKGGVAAAHLSFDETNGEWTIKGEPWKRSPLRAILDFLGL